MFSKELGAKLDKYHLLKHPFYQKYWNEGRLTREIIKDYAEQYYQHVKAFPRYISATHSICDDIEKRKLPEGTTGVVITAIDPESPIKNLFVNNIIIEAQKKKIKTPGDLQNIIKSSLVSKNKSILVVIYNNENQISYIGIKLK